MGCGAARLAGRRAQASSQARGLLLLLGSSTMMCLYLLQGVLGLGGALCDAYEPENIPGLESAAAIGAGKLSGGGAVLRLPCLRPARRGRCLGWIRAMHDWHSWLRSSHRCA